MNKKIIHTVFEAIAARLPEKTAICEENKSISYGALNASANRIAHLLRSRGLGRDSIAAAMMPGSIHLVTALLAIFKAGGIYLPVDPTFPRKRLSAMFAHSVPEILITSIAVKEAVLETLSALDMRLPAVLVLGEENSLSLYKQQNGAWTSVALDETVLCAENPKLVNDPDDGNYIFYTSGSTGEAKAFLGCHKSLSHFIHWEGKTLNIDENYRVSQLSQFTFDASLRDIFLPLSYGATLYIPTAATKTNMVQLVDWIANTGINLLHCVPSLFRLITKELGQGSAGNPFPYLRYVLMAGEPLYVKDIQRWRELAGTHTTIINLYGTSETTMAKTFYCIGDTSGDPSQMIPAGQPIDNAAVLVLNDGIPCAAGETGEVYIRTPFMTKGYYKNEQLNNDVFVQNPLVDFKDLLHRTGDLGRLLPDGNLEVLGRTDDQVKVNGVRAGLNEITRAVLGVPGVQDAVVTVQQGSSMENELRCYFIAPQLEADALRQALQEELSPSLIPSFFMKMDRFPLTVNGKVDKRSLPKPENAMVDEAAYEAPEGPMEKEMEEMWKELLGLGRIGRNMPFFKIGGTSLKAIQLISKVYKKYAVLIKVNDIFSNASIAQLTALIASRRKSTDDNILPVKVQPYYPVTHAQKRLWIMDQFQAEKTAYNIPGAFFLQGDLDIPALEKAFRQVIARHESLRTVFVMVDGVVMSKINEPADSLFTLEVVDCNAKVAADPAVKAIALEKLTAPFDLEAGPLLRACLLQVAGNAHVLLMTMHHIISDGWSIQVMVKELLDFYNGHVSGKEIVLPSLPVQYKDYTAWLEQRLSAEAMQAHRRYWLGRFEGELPVLQLPTDFSRPAVKSTRGANAVFEMDAAQAALIREAARSNDVSVYMTLLAVLNLLLYHYSGQQDLVVGSPIAGRVHKDLDKQVGLYVNLLAIRTQLQLDASFSDLLKNVKAALLGAYEHQLYPFDLLVKELHLEHDERRSPLTDVWIQHSDNSWIEQLYSGDTGQLRIQPYNAGYNLSKVDLTFKFTESANSIELVIEYNTDLFETGTVERMGNDLVRLATMAAQQAMQPVKEIVRGLQPAAAANMMASLVSESISNEY